MHRNVVLALSSRRESGGLVALYGRGSVTEQSFAPPTASNNDVGRAAPLLDVQDGPQPAAQHLRVRQRGYLACTSWRRGSTSSPCSTRSSCLERRARPAAGAIARVGDAEPPARHFRAS